MCVVLKIDDYRVVIYLRIFETSDLIISPANTRLSSLADFDIIFRYSDIKIIFSLENEELTGS